MSDTSKFDNLARRLRARVERSASRDQSLDWKAADAIDHLQAECARLAAESKRLAAEMRSFQREVAAAERHAATLSEHPPADVGVTRPYAVPPARALGLQEAADLLNLSYSTVFENRRALGFFQVGRLWRIWPETLQEELERRTTKSNSRGSGIAPRLPADRIPPARPHSLSPSARQAAKEFDALLKPVLERRRRHNAAK
ncbi:hypothetical protein WJ61_30610 [Burkholderia ubonensis]|uniref:hypothetical protein n=1 Tax=Burkholderia ubonensis TaxID=101571 RepID=UPI000754ECEB|nr:hypothetical protein [Burkholderia ubonensis]KVM66021.1 hypothetical protein WJ61_30610 [Burkholderia ubonensis]